MAPETPILIDKMGIKETKEILVGALEIAVTLLEQLNDGFQFDDANAWYDKIVNDAAFRSKMVAAYEGSGKAPSEIADLDILEVTELAMAVLAYIPILISAFNAKKSA